MEKQVAQLIENTQLSLIENVNVSMIQTTMKKIQSFQEIIKNNFVAKTDYGIIPGCQKPTMLKPGAEKICMLFGLRSEFDILDCEKDFREGFFQYQVKAKLFKGELLITEGLGCCNSKEKKYRNVDPCDIDNTILKMAKKRALIDAVLLVASLSNLYTQDMEDMQDLEIKSKEDEKKAVYTDHGVITEKQIKRMFGISNRQYDVVKAVMAKYGYKDSKEVKKVDYEKICEEITAAVFGGNKQTA